jgi:hypothetical protein
MIGDEDESSVVFFIMLVKVKMAESISERVFKGIFKDMLFSMKCENLFQSILPGVRMGTYLRRPINCLMLIR